MFVLKPGQGTLFRNDKGDNAKRPDYRGEVNVGGTVYELAGWKKDGARGPFLSLSAKPKQEKPSTAPAKTADPDDDLPF